MDEFKDIYIKYANDVKIFLIYLTNDINLSEELTQETFYQALKSINRYNGKCKYGYVKLQNIDIMII